MKDLVFNRVEIPVESQDMENFKDLEPQYRTQHIVKPFSKENNYIVNDTNYTLTYSAPRD